MSKENLEVKKKGIVRILVEYVNGVISTGTGFVYKNNGNIFTCGHVITSMDLKILVKNPDFISTSGNNIHEKTKNYCDQKIRSIKAEYYDGMVRNLKLGIIDEFYDIAQLIPIRATNSTQFLSINSNYIFDYCDSVFFCGYQLMNGYSADKSPLAINYGIVSTFGNIEVAGGKYKMIQINSITLGGNSGGPVFITGNEEVVAILNGNMNWGRDDLVVSDSDGNNQTSSLRTPLSIGYITSFKLLKDKSLLSGEL